MAQPERQFAFRLCVALGIRHPDYLDISSRQFSDWLAWYTHEPFGELRADLQAGIIASTINNRMRNKGERARPPTEFMPYYEKPEQTPEQIRATLRRILRRPLLNGNSRNNRG